ncbi:MAG: hypothetical protein HYX41_07590 [Bdellovibrio sp.]|nr:hypothetical protein [Bdellovibrio sp.]
MEGQIANILFYKPFLRICATSDRKAKTGIVLVGLTVLGALFSFPPVWASPTPAPEAKTSSAQVPLEGILFDRVEDTTVYFKTQAGSGDSSPEVRPMKTQISDLFYLGQISPEKGSPYFLMTGRPCTDCMDDKTVYALRPGTVKPSSFVFPGKILDPKNRSLLFESRAFFGKCLRGKGDVYVVFQKERVDKKKQLQASVYVAEAKTDSLSESLLERHLPSLQHTLRQVKKKSCKEIPGRNRLMLNKPLDLNPKNRDSDDDDRNEDDTEEKPSVSETP